MVTLLDGSMGTELIRRGAARRGGLWSAQALLDSPDAVTALHRDYIAAGAQVITTNTYSTVPSYLSKAGAQHRVTELAELAGRLARKAVTETTREGGTKTATEAALVAGCLPPLEESYRPDLVPAPERAIPVYRELATALAPWVDVFLCETMSSASEARTAASVALQSSNASRQQPVYVAWTLDDEPGKGLRSGESLVEALNALDDLDVRGFLVNCSRPEALLAGLTQLKALTDKPLGCYANRMEGVPAGWTLDNELVIQYRDDLSAAVFAEWGKRCSSAGASIIGGCCGTRPRDIRALSDALGQRLTKQ